MGHLTHRGERAHGRRAGGYSGLVSNPSTGAVIVFCLFAFLFFGVLLTGAAILDRRRVKEVHDAIPERSEGAHEVPHVEVHRAYELEQDEDERHRHAG